MSAERRPMRMCLRAALVGIALVAVTAGCGQSDLAEPAQLPADEASNPASTSAPSTNGPTTTLSTALFGLRCDAEMESTVYDYDEGADGFPTVEEAARDWMTNGDGALLEVGAFRLDLVADPTGGVDLVDDEGEVRVELVARDYGNGWLIESTERCYDG